MESKISTDSPKQGSPEELPSLFKYMTTKTVNGFDTTSSPRGEPAVDNGPEAVSNHIQANPISMFSQVSPLQSHSISISMPASPSGFHVEQAKRVPADGKPETTPSSGPPSGSNIFSSIQPKKTKFYSQPIEAVAEDQVLKPLESQQRTARYDKRFDSFKTWSGKLERQLSNLRGRPLAPEEIDHSQITQPEAVPAVDRYFDALEGPELETLKSSEELVLPEDKKWPFLLRFPISSFGMCLGVSSQAMLWKTLATSPSVSFLHVSLTVNLVLWCISLAIMATVSLIYILKIIFYFEAVRREYYHPVRVNFFFAPWIACLFLTIGLPPSVAGNPHAALWYVLMAPILCLELKIYGQWMSGGQRRLSKVANPSNHLSIVGNFVGALLGATMGLREGPIFFFAVGLAHYTVLFVTLYQRLPTNETLPKELHPVFFLFVAAPNVACMAWAKISGEFNYASRIAYFIALFLYISLAVRINFFRGFKFSLAWWAYTFPMTGASIATIRYSAEVNNWLTESLSVALSGISTLTVTALLVSTILHAFVFHDLFPNDISIAISQKRPKSRKKHHHLRESSLEANDIETGVCSASVVNS